MNRTKNLSDAIATQLMSASSPTSSILTMNSSSLLFEPEITIRRLFKCCGAGRTCGVCNLTKANAFMATNKLLTPALASTSRAKSGTSSVHYTCTFCSFVCTWKYDLKLHLKQKHGIHKKL